MRDLQLVGWRSTRLLETVDSAVCGSGQITASVKLRPSGGRVNQQCPKSVALPVFDCLRQNNRAIGRSWSSFTISRDKCSFVSRQKHQSGVARQDRCQKPLASPICPSLVLPAVSSSPHATPCSQAINATAGTNLHCAFDLHTCFVPFSGPALVPSTVCSSRLL